MKIRPEHLEVLKTNITPLDTPEKRQKYINGDFFNAEHTKDVDKRYRWDLLFAAPGLSNWLRFTIYAYAGDHHIDTALRSIVPPLEVKP
jgi:hypothetical protein